MADPVRDDMNVNYGTLFFCFMWKMYVYFIADA